jgi:hypothetical protein
VPSQSFCQSPRPRGAHLHALLARAPAGFRNTASASRHPLLSAALLAGFVGVLHALPLGRPTRFPGADFAFRFFLSGLASRGGEWRTGIIPAAPPAILEVGGTEPAANLVASPADPGDAAAGARDALRRTAPSPPLLWVS